MALRVAHPPSIPRRRRRWAPQIAAVLTAALTLVACATGPRPTLADTSEWDAPTGEAVVDALLTRFAGLDAAVFTAQYSITNNFGPLTREAVVAHDAEGRRSITIGQVRYLLDTAGSRTCRLTTGECTEGAQDAAVSDLQVTHQFYARSAASRLRNDAARRVGPIDGYEAEFAGQSVQCASVPVTGGSKVYCVTADGPLATYQGPDVLIELTGYSSEVDPELFSRSG